jgi:hypothetical protein
MRFASDYFTAQILGSNVPDEDPTIPFDGPTHRPPQRPLIKAVLFTFGDSSGNRAITMVRQNRPGDRYPAGYRDN